MVKDASEGVWREELDGTLVQLLGIPAAVL
jgi:hypothetical protein